MLFFCLSLSCVPNVASVSGMSIRDSPFSFSYVYLHTKTYNYGKLPLHILFCHSITDPGTNDDNNPPNNIYAIIFVSSLTGKKYLYFFFIEK